MVNVKGANLMKKIITISMALVFAFAIGIAYAGDILPAPGTWDNGITMFAPGYVTTGPVFSRVMPGEGESLSHIDSLALDNGITLSSLGSIDTESIYKAAGLESSVAEGSAAGGYAEGPGMDLRNGVTVFSDSPVDAN